VARLATTACPRLGELARECVGELRVDCPGGRWVCIVVGEVAAAGVTVGGVVRFAGLVVKLVSTPVLISSGFLGSSSSSSESS
jgi:hypothetical protein